MHSGKNFHMDAYSIIVQSSQKVEKTKCLLTNEKINKMWHAYIIEYCLAVKRNEVLIHATTRMNLENIILSEKNPVTKSHILCNSTYEMSRIGKSIDRT